MKTTQQVRQLLDKMDAAVARGDRWAAINLAAEMENVAVAVSDQVQWWGEQDEAVVYRGWALRAAHHGECPDDVGMPYIGPDDIRSPEGRFLPKQVRERIYASWVGDIAQSA